MLHWSLEAAVLVAVAGLAAPLAAAQDEVGEQPVAGDSVAEAALAEAQGAEAQGVGDPVADLTLLANGLESFRATYRLFSEASGEISVELLYQAPGSARLVYGTATASSKVWYVDGVLSLRNESSAGTSHGRYDTREFLAEVPSVQAALAREFEVLSPGGDLGPGPVFHMEPNLTGDATGAALSITVSFARRRPALFCYGFEHRSRLGAASVANGVVSFGDLEDVFFTLSAEHGLPVASRARGSKGEATLDLVAFDSEPELAESEFVPPEPGPDSQDVSAAAVGVARRPFTPEPQRLEAWWGIAGLLERGQVEWDDATRERCGRVFEELHGLFLPARFEDLIAASDVTSGEEVERILREHGECPLDDREEHVEEVRVNIREAMDVVRERFLAPLEVPPELEGAGPPERLAEILALELEAAGALFERTVSGPILESFERRARGLLK